MRAFQLCQTYGKCLTFNILWVQSSIFFYGRMQKNYFPNQKDLISHIQELKMMVKRAAKMGLGITLDYQQASPSISFVPPIGMLAKLIPREHGCQKWAFLPFHKCLIWKGNTDLFNSDNKHVSLLQHVHTLNKLWFFFIFKHYPHHEYFPWYCQLLRPVSFFIILVKSLMSQIESAACIVAL